MIAENLDEPGDVSDSEALYLTHEESRAVLERKFEVLEDLDNKAMHSVRTAVVVLGLVVSALTLLKRDGTALFKVVPALTTGTSTLCLLVAIVTGIGTYSTSGAPDGVSRTYRDDVREGGYDEVDWLLVLLGGYDQWIEGVTRTIQRKERLLLWTQLSLATGLLLTAASVILYTATN